MADEPQNETKTPERTGDEPDGESNQDAGANAADEGFQEDGMNAHVVPDGMNAHSEPAKNQ